MNDAAKNIAPAFELLEKIFDYIIYSVHDCINNNQKSKVAIVYLKSLTSEAGLWRFGDFQIAEEADLVNGDAEQINEIISSSDFNINYCPFCGLRLATHLFT